MRESALRVTGPIGRAWARTPLSIALKSIRRHLGHYFGCCETDRSGTGCHHLRTCLSNNAGRLSAFCAGSASVAGTVYSATNLELPSNALANGVRVYCPPSTSCPQWRGGPKVDLIKSSA